MSVAKAKKPKRDTTVPEAAKKLGVTPRKLRSWIHDGLAPRQIARTRAPSTGEGFARRVNVEEVRAWRKSVDERVEWKCAQADAERKRVKAVKEEKEKIATDLVNMAWTLGPRRHGQVRRLKRLSLVKLRKIRDWWGSVNGTGE